MVKCIDCENQIPCGHNGNGRYVCWCAKDKLKRVRVVEYERYCNVGAYISKNKEK